MKKELKEIAVAEINLDNDNPRKNTKPEQELVDSIKAVGVKIPPIVSIKQKEIGRPEYILVAGARRINAAKLAGIEKVTCMVIDGSPEEVFETTLIENSHRKSLTILEQVYAVNTLLELNANNIGKVAGKLSMTVPAVRRVLLINKLCPDIKKELNDPDSSISRMPIDMLGLVAALPKSQQEKWDLWSLDNIKTPKELKAWINKRFRFDLSSAKWNIEDDALAGEGACTKCKKQSANSQQQLFEEDASSKKGICQDPECWKKKIKAYVQNCINDAVKIDPKLMIVDQGGILENKYPHFLDGHYQESCKGTINCMHFQADGSFKKYKVIAEKGIKLAKTSGPKTMVERTEQLDGLRVGLVLDDLKVYIDTKEARDHAVTKHSLKELAALLISFKQGIVIFKQEELTVYEKLVKDESLKFQVGYSEKKSYEESVIGLLWYSVKDDLINVLGYHNSQSALDNEKIAKFISEYTGFDWKKSLEKAVIAKPEPKSWAGLNKDGTKKETIKEPKKVKVADCHKCRKPHTNDCATCSATTGIPKKRKVKPELKKGSIGTSPF